MHQGLTELLKSAGISDSQGSNLDSLSRMLNGADRGGAAADSVASVVQDATEQVRQLRTVTQTNVNSVTANTDALTQAGELQGSSGNGIGSALQQLAGSVLGGGGLGGVLGGGSSQGGLFSGLLGGLFGAIPLLSGIESLFGGGHSQPPPLTPYQAPTSQHFEEAVSGGTAGDAVYGATGQPRTSSFTELALSGLGTSGSSAGSTPSGGQAGSQTAASTAPQINVHVQAMDSQSFMDRAGDIANAVRSAMLNMHSINDVVSDL